MVWNEFAHEQVNPAAQAIYPDGIHVAIADGLRRVPPRTTHASPIDVGTATLPDADHGLSMDRLARTDVLLWWGHMQHDLVDDTVVDRVKKRVLEGMGLVVLHSGHYSKIFRALLGTNCSLSWRINDESERLWVLEPSHPIAAGLGPCVELPAEETYGERFDVPAPDDTVFVSWFEGGDVFRSGLCWQRGHGRLFYFRPGHETYPTYHNPDVQQILANAVQWAAPRVTLPDSCPMTQPRVPVARLSPKAPG